MTENTQTEPVLDFEVPDDASEITPPEQAPYRTLLEIWRAVLEPATDREMFKEPIAPQWAVKMVTTYPGVTFADVEQIHVGVFELAAELAALLHEEIESDDEALKKATAQEDAQENADHYRNLLAVWQIHLQNEELEWCPSDFDAARRLAVLSEVQQMFLGQTGLVAHLDSIGFQFTEDDQAELQARLTEARRAKLEAEGE